MTSPDDFDVITAMYAYGGSFVSALGQLWRLADDDNRARLKTAFPEYWAEYYELALLKQRESVKP